MGDVTVYKTLNSTYEVDAEAKQIRRTAGVNPPTQHQGSDGVWSSYESLTQNPHGGLSIVWDSERVTWTSPIVETVRAQSE